MANLPFSKKQSQRGISLSLSLSSMTNLLLAWQRTCMDKLAGCEVLEFLRSGLPAQDFVAVRVTAEPGDDVAMATGLVRGELEYAAKLLGRLSHQFFCEFDYPLLVREILGVPQGQEKEGFFPRVLEGRIVTDLDSFECEAECFGILGERLSSSTMDRT